MLKSMSFVIIFTSISYAGFCQATHTVTVHVNQPPVCSIVATAVQFEEPSVYPNPASEILHIKNLQSKSQIDIHDAVGRRVYSKFVETENTLAIDVTLFNRGLYHVFIRDQQKNYRAKAVID